MKIQSYTYPKSSFLAMEKDMGLLVDMIMNNDRLKKMLYYTTPDCLKRPPLTREQTRSLFGNQIKMIPKLYVDKSVMNYIVISFDNFIPNDTNPEFRNNRLEFDIVCHFDQWHMQDFELRPYKIAAEIDTMVNHKRLTGIGEIEFIGATQSVLTDEFAALCLLYRVVHGEEDKKNMPNPMNEEEYIEHFDNLFNEDK